MQNDPSRLAGQNSVSRKQAIAWYTKREKVLFAAEQYATRVSCSHLSPANLPGSTGYDINYVGKLASMAFPPKC